MTRLYLESTDFGSGKNLTQVPIYSMPDQKDGVVVFLLSGSYEYDLELIKHMPPPRTNYRNIIIPYSLTGRIGTADFKYSISGSKYNERVQYLQKQKMVPQLIVAKPTFSKTSQANVYVPISDVFRQLNQVVRGQSNDYIEQNVMNMMSQFMQLFPNTKKKIWVIDSNRFKIYDGDNPDAIGSDLVNAVLTAAINGTRAKLSHDTTFIFRSGGMDYKMDLRADMADSEGVKKMCEKIGIPFKSQNRQPVATGEDLDTMLANAKAEQGEEEPDQSGPSLKQSIAALKAKYDVKTEDAPKDSLNAAKTLEINAQLLHRITPDTSAISDYKKISSQIADGGDHPVENSIIDKASKELSGSRAAIDSDNAMRAISTPRELRIRQDVGKIQLDKLNLQKLSTVADTPIPPPTHPLRITTTNPGAMRGSSFPNISRVYEEQMMDQDIVATFMNLSKLPEGFTVTGVEISDMSTPLSLINNWRINLKNRRTGSQSHINMYVPILKNGKFYHNGTWYSISKQDFPIPVMKINPKLVMLTSNYNKISVMRYDTKSLVDLTQMMKAVNSVTKPDGTNKYVKTGSSTMTNSRYVSTIEYDEYAKRWYSFENPDAKCRIVFNREQCMREFGFVTVDENEFCIGMIDQVPIVLNTETGLDRHERSITSILLTVLPPEIRSIFDKIKPNKISMYAQIKIGVITPLGVSIAAWEGISSLLEKSKAKHKFINGREDATGYLVFKFKDKSLAVQNTLVNQLIFNSFYRINTKDYNFDEFDTPIMDSNSIYVDIFNNMFFRQYSQLTTFITMYYFFMDAITADVCNHYHIPNDVASLLIYAVNMLADNNFTRETTSSLYRIRSSEIVPAIIHYILAREISKYNNNVGSKKKDRKLVVNPNELLNTLESVETVSSANALNPMVELHQNETISLKGYRGVNNERAFTRAKRSYEDSMIGKLAMSSPNSAGVGINRQLTIDPKIESVRGYTSAKGPDENYNDLQLASFSELLTPGTVSRDDAIRNAIATSQTSHIVSTAEAEPVLVSNGVDEIAASYLSDEFVVMAKEDGKVIEINDGYMIVQYKSGKKQAIPVMDRYSFNSGSGFYVDNKLKSNFELNDSFKKDDILAYHEKFFSKDSSGMVRLNIGPLAKVAFCGLYSTYEDAGLITEKMSKKLATSVTMKQASKLEATDDVEFVVKVGDEVEIGDPLIIFGLGDTGDKAVDTFLQAFQKAGANLADTAKRVVRSKHAGRVVDVRMYTIKSMDKLSPSLFEILDNHFKENIRKRKILDKHDKSNTVYKLDTLYTLPTQPLKGSSIKGINCDVLIEVYIEHDDEVSVGDKCVVYAASKQVISEVIPEGLEPYAESTPDEEISMFVAPSSILKRMIPSVLITGAANKVLLELKKQVRDIWEGK